MERFSKYSAVYLCAHRANCDASILLSITSWSARRRKVILAQQEHSDTSMK